MIGNPTRPGDLAVIIRCRYVANVGATVQVLSEAGVFREARAATPVVAETETGGGASARLIAPGQSFWIDDAGLQPIRPPAPDEAIEYRENVGVEA